VDDIKFLNPGLNSNVIPAFDDEPYQLKLPSNMLSVWDNMKDSIILSSADVVPQYRAKYMYGVGNVHVVRRGETLASISKKYHVAPALVKQWNHLHGTSVRVGQKIKLYGGVSERTYASASKKSKHHTSTTSAGNSNKVVYYRIKNGDTLWSIAKRYKGVTVADIRASNSLNKTTSLRPGTTLKILL
jgi:membrane-bound lytic murein transglycosylase D